MKRMFLLLSSVVIFVSTDITLGNILTENEDFSSLNYDPGRDYSRFTGRVTDKNDAERILKIQAETKNVQFLKIGDLLTFEIKSGLGKKLPCRAHVKSSGEAHYLVIRVEELGPCWNRSHYFRRGTLLYFTSVLMQTRVRDATAFRTLLLRRKEDFLKQLNGINHFLASYDQQKLLAVAQYDQQIMELQRKKQRSMNSLINKKSDYIRLQKVMVKKLDALDKDLEFYKIHQEKNTRDGWKSELLFGIPVEGP